jgi:hypothetical protein
MRALTVVLGLPVLLLVAASCQGSSVPDRESTAGRSESMTVACGTCPSPPASSASAEAAPFFALATAKTDAGTTDAGTPGKFDGGTPDAGTGCPIPPGCVPLGSTPTKNIGWMECYRQKPAACDLSQQCLRETPCDMDGSLQGQIKSSCCKPGKSAADKLTCIADRVDAELGGTADPTEKYVCRDHAKCQNDIALSCGIPTVWTCGMKGDDDGHAWTEHPIDTNGDGKPDIVIVIDPYNQIYYQCPIK